MNDTSPEIEKILFERMGRKTSAERLEIGCRMFDFSKEIVRSSLLNSNPHISPVQLRKELFLRFYGHEFEGLQREKILNWISRTKEHFSPAE